VTLRGGVFVALLVALLGGWLWGASGRWALDRALQAAELRNDLLEARASVLGARVSLCDADFGEMSRQLGDARGFVRRAGERLDTPGSNDDPQRLGLAGFGAEFDAALWLAARLTSGAAAASSR
jgi:hypothetical protein